MLNSEITGSNVPEGHMTCYWTSDLTCQITCYLTCYITYNLAPNSCAQFLPFDLCALPYLRNCWQCLVRVVLSFAGLRFFSKIKLGQPARSISSKYIKLLTA